MDVARNLAPRQDEFDADSSHRREQRPPIGSGLGPLGVARTQQHMELMGGQRLGAVVRRSGPPAEASLGKTLLAEPKTLPVVDEHFHRCCTPIAKHEHSAVKRILTQDLLAESHETVDAVAEVDGLDRDEDPHLRRDLQHHGDSQKLRLTAAKSGAPAPFTSIRMRDPSHFSSSIVHSHALPNGAAVSSTKVAGAIPHCGTGLSARRFLRSYEPRSNAVPVP